MYSSRILRNMGSTGNKLMNETSPKERTILYAAGALAGLAGLVYWVNYRGEDSTRNKKQPPNAENPSLKK